MVVQCIGLRKKRIIEMNLIIHFCSKYLVNTQYVPGTVLGAAVTKKREQVLKLLLERHTYKYNISSALQHFVAIYNDLYPRWYRNPEEGNSKGVYRGSNSLAG